jgi:hypothetical protein
MGLCIFIHVIFNFKKSCHWFVCSSPCVDFFCFLCLFVCSIFILFYYFIIFLVVCNLFVYLFCLYVPKNVHFCSITIILCFSILKIF